MRIQLVSDLHLEFLSDYGKSLAKKIITDADVLVIAGDLAPLAQIEKEAEWFLSEMVDNYKDVIYVLGNHEYYRSNPTEITKIVDRLRTKFIGRIHIFTTGGFVDIEDQRFVCGTMWFPYGVDNAFYERYMTDFRVIKEFNPWVYDQNTAFRDYLDRLLPVKEGNIVVTHHLPSEQSVNDRYKGEPSNCFFLSEEGNRIAKYSPKLWVHGHTHLSCDYTIGDTRVVCNPKGYPHEVGPTFDKHLVIEV